MGKQGMKRPDEAKPHAHNNAAPDPMVIKKKKTQGKENQGNPPQHS